MKQTNALAFSRSVRVNLTAGQSASLDLTADTLNLRIGQNTEIQPAVTLGTPAVGTAVSEPSACPATVEVFDNLAGHTETFQPGEINPGPIGVSGVATPVAAQ